MFHKKYSFHSNDPIKDNRLTSNIRMLCQLLENDNVREHNRLVEYFNDTITLTDLIELKGQIQLNKNWNSAPIFEIKYKRYLNFVLELIRNNKLKQILEQ